MARKLAGVPESKAVTWLIAGTAAYTLLIVACFLATLVFNSWGEREARGQARIVANADSQPPLELFDVPEVDLLQLPRHLNAQQAKLTLKQKAAEISAKNQVKSDAFMEETIKARADLQGLPFQMGHQCRLTAQLATQFASAVTVVRESLDSEQRSVLPDTDAVAEFWKNWSLAPNHDHTPAGVAALSQILGPDKLSRRQSLAKHLGEIGHPKATQALIKQAVFDFDRRVRTTALDGLKDRPRQDSTETLLQGIRYPWAPAARNAAQAIVKLDRRDLIPELVKFLDEADPRDPFEAKVDGEECFMVREVVKINHHRNCLLCHPPASQQNVMLTSIVNEVPGKMPSPGESFAPPESREAYGGTQMPDTPLVRADATYLRQDFSMLQPVANAAPWPEMQRFDFIVRNRVLKDDELRDLVKRKAAREPGYVSENHRAAVAALEGLTGKQAGTTAAAWRQELKLPAAAEKVVAQR